VENQVGNVREWLFTPRPSFADFSALNAWLEDRCRELAKRLHPEQKDRPIADVFAEEQGRLRPLSTSFDGYFEQPCRVSSTCLVSYDRNRYSVPAEWAGQRVSLRAWADRIGVVAEDTLIAEHVRSFGRERMILDPWHYLPVLEKKPGALRHGAPFQDWKLPGPLLAVKERLLKQPQGDRAFVDVLLALREHGSQILTTACERALAHHTVTAPVILNHVARLVAPPPPLPVVATTLVLKEAPAANCERYDTLRGSAPC
jgi:hypothetical protein